MNAKKSSFDGTFTGQNLAPEKPAQVIFPARFFKLSIPFHSRFLH